MKTIKREDLTRAVEGLGLEPKDVLYAHLSPREIHVRLVERDETGRKIYLRDSEGNVDRIRTRVEVFDVV